MPLVRFLNVGDAAAPLEVEVPRGASILEAAKKSGAPEGDRCGGVCACSTCHVYVKTGAALLAEQEDEELDILEKAFQPRASSRLGCQARIERDGVVEVSVTEESFKAFMDEHPEEKERVRGLWRPPV